MKKLLKKIFSFLSKKKEGKMIDSLFIPKGKFGKIKNPAEWLATR
ncbi:MAG: hypothetical protein WC397_03615 [Candidatus Paceibacterota bacterium]|jgi:hypothetical protein